VVKATMANAFIYAQDGEADVHLTIGIWLCADNCARVFSHMSFQSRQSLRTVSGAWWLRAMNSGKWPWPIG